MIGFGRETKLMNPAVAMLLLVLSAGYSPPFGHKVGAHAGERSRWFCEPVVTKTIVNATMQGAASAPLVWTRLNCTGETPLGMVGPGMIFNVLVADLENDNVFITPMVVSKNTNANQLAPLNVLAKQDPRIVAGVNGGYFFRLDVRQFFDDVCIGKNASDAEKAVNISEPNFGVGDTLVLRNGSLLSSNCNPIYGYNRPTTLVLNGTSSFIVVQEQGAGPLLGVTDCISAGPNLVSFNATSAESYVDVPVDDENLNIFEYAANTAVGLRGRVTRDAPRYRELVMVTSNGYDSCPLSPSCGIWSWSFGYFLKDYLNVTEAMGMDQGGSTTMFVDGEGRDGIVSCSQNAECTGGARSVYSALMIGVNRRQ
jgi:hypothetical protein